MGYSNSTFNSCSLFVVGIRNECYQGRGREKKKI